MGVEIHNGQVIVDGQPETAGAAPAPVLEPLKLPPGPVEDINPEDLAARMAQIISLGIDNKLTPMEITNSLLTARTAAGHKLVWTRFDVHQTFALWAKKLSGSNRV